MSAGGRETDSQWVILSEEWEGDRQSLAHIVSMRGRDRHSVVHSVSRGEECRQWVILSAWGEGDRQS